MDYLTKLWDSINKLIRTITGKPDVFKELGMDKKDVDHFLKCIREGNKDINGDGTVTELEVLMYDIGVKYVANMAKPESKLRKILTVITEVIIIGTSIFLIVKQFV